MNIVFHEQVCYERVLLNVLC